MTPISCFLLALLSPLSFCLWFFWTVAKEAEALRKTKDRLQGHYKDN